MPRWDFKSARAALFAMAHPDFKPLGEYAEEATELIDPRREPDKEWPVYGVNNDTGVFLSTIQKGSDFSSNYKRIKKDFFFHNPTRANVGSLGRVPEVPEDAITSPEYQVWKTKPGLLPEFAEILIRTEFFLDQVECHRVGGVKERLFVQNLLEIPVPVPDLSIQKQIVSLWITARAGVSSDLESAKNAPKIAAKTLVQELGLTDLQASDDRKVFVSRWRNMHRWGVEIARELVRRPQLSESPYAIVSLSDVVEDLQNGWSPKCLARQARENEWGVLKVGAVSFGWFDETQNKALPSELKPREQYEVEPGDLIISRANIARYVGACALVEKARPRLMLCDKLFRVVWKEHSPILPQFLDEVLKIPQVRWQIENSLTGASPTMKNISKPALMALRFPLPPPDVQRAIVAEIDAIRGKMRTLKADAEDAQRNAVKAVEEMILGTPAVKAI